MGAAHLGSRLQGVFLIGGRECGDNGLFVTVLSLGQESAAKVRVGEDAANPVRPLVDAGAQLGNGILVGMPQPAAYKAMAAGLAVDVVTGIGAFATGS